MAESSILINDQIGGKAVAMRTAIDLDVDDNIRSVQLMDIAGRRALFNALYSSEGAESISEITRGDQSKIVLSVKTPAIFTDIFIQIQFKAIYGYDEAIVALKQLHLVPADVVENTSGSIYLFSEPHIIDLSGASKIVIRAWGTGFDVDSAMYVYYGLI